MTTDPMTQKGNAASTEGQGTVDDIADMTDAEILRRIIAETERPLLRRIAELEAKLVDAERTIYRSK